jgi:hypothetical protein
VSAEGRDAVRQLAHLRRRPLRVIARLVKQDARALAPLLERLPCEVERDDRVDEALLGAVVQVAHDATAFLVRGGHDPSP